jgi:hypothetical protein
MYVTSILRLSFILIGFEVLTEVVMKLYILGYIQRYIPQDIPWGPEPWMTALATAKSNLPDSTDPEDT